MSRLAKQPINIPTGIEVKTDGKTFTVKGGKGEITRNFDTDVIGIEVKDGTIVLTPKGEDVFTRALWGTYASHFMNMIEGVTNGYQKKLILEGVGFKSEVKGNNLELALGFSHPVVVPIPAGITVTAEKNLITVSGIDKERVGQFAAVLRSMKKPEPYKGKGMRYENEVIRRKQGKKTV